MITSKFSRYNKVHILSEFGPHGDIALCGFVTDRPFKVPADAEVDCGTCRRIWEEENR